MLTSGEHTITLSKEGYDTWTKTVDIKEGLLYRVHYPRLFLKNRTSEKALSATGVTYATVSPDHSSLLLINGTTEWLYVNLNEEKITPKKLDISSVFSDVSIASGAKTGLFTGEIVDVDWDTNGSRALFKTKSENGVEWVLLNPKDIKSSINLTREFGTNFIDLKIFDNDANTLLAVLNNNLHRLDVSGRSVSAVIVENVIDYDYYNNELFFSASKNVPGEELTYYYLGSLKLGDKIEELAETTTPAKVAITKFYEEKYLLTLENSTLKVYQKDGFAPLFEFNLSFSPANLKVGHEGEFIVLYSGSQIATLDMETMLVGEWTAKGEGFGWLDNDMIYTVNGGELIVYDFDGLNRRDIAKNVSNQFPVMITNNRYLYYFSDGNLIREWLIPR